jgi:hypothetical protein
LVLVLLLVSPAASASALSSLDHKPPSSVIENSLMGVFFYPSFWTADGSRQF